MARAHGTQVELPNNKYGKVSQGQIVKVLKFYAKEFGHLISGTGQVTKEESGQV